MPLEVLSSQGREGLATVFVARTPSGKLIEFAESFQPGLPLEKKWVIILSVMQGCPVHCLMCDAGGRFNGSLSKEEILDQVRHVVARRGFGKKIPSKKWKIQFTRMGEPAYNDAVLEALEAFPEEFDAPCLIPSLSTVAPAGREKFFERLLEIKDHHYSNGRFQLQFSLHTTDEKKREALIPIRKWGFKQIADYGERFYRPGDRKITLNFALMKDYPVEPEVIAKHFSPEKFLIKITPLNPTRKAMDNGLACAFDPLDADPVPGLVAGFKAHGFEVLVSIGPLEENQVGSNCGQFVSALQKDKA